MSGGKNDKNINKIDEVNKKRKYSQISTTADCQKMVHNEESENRPGKEQTNKLGQNVAKAASSSCKKFKLNRSWLVVPPDTPYLHFFGFRQKSCFVEEWMIGDGIFLSDSQIDAKLTRANVCFNETGGQGAEFDDICEELKKKAPRNERVLATLLQFVQGNDAAQEQLFLSHLLFLKPTDEDLKRKHRNALIHLENVDGPLFAEIGQMHCRFLKMLEDLKENNNLIKTQLIVSRRAFFWQRFTANTCALEGNELNLREVVKIFKEKEEQIINEIDEESEEDTNGGQKRRHDCQEVLGMKAALDHLASLEFTRPEHLKQLGLELLTRIHELMFDPIENKNFEDAGEYRDETLEMHFANSSFSPVEWDYVPEEMDKWFRMVNEEWPEMVANEKMHAVEFAAIASFFFLHIHPWPDGNGRSSRLILNSILECYSFPPIIILNAKSEKYMRPLEEDNLLGFVRCVADYVRDTLRVSIADGMPYPCV